MCARVCVLLSEMGCVLFYSWKIAHRANIICCIMYPTLNKSYLILSSSYLITMMSYRWYFASWLVLLVTVWVNSLWPNDAIWRHRSGSTLAQVMACCLMAPSHYLNQCWLIINKVQRHLAERNFTRKTQPSVTKVISKITYPKFNLNLPGSNELSGSSLIQVMARCLFSPKPLSKSMLAYCQLDL